MRKTFFDPGIVQEIVQEEVEEISDKNYQAKKEYLKEENAGYGKADNVLAKKQAEVSSALSQISFLADEVKNDNFSEVVVTKKEKQIVRKNVKKSAKKEQSGFSLFSFMSSSKDKSSKDNNNYQEEPEFEEREFVEESSKKQKEESQELSKKKEEFFGATILDDEKDRENVSLEEDILNVPAFFRRKKI